MSQIDRETISTNLRGIAAHLEELAKSSAGTLPRGQLNMCVRYAALATELAGRDGFCTHLAQIQLPKGLAQRSLRANYHLGLMSGIDEPETRTVRRIPYSWLDWTYLTDAARTGGEFVPRQHESVWDWVQVDFRCQGPWTQGSGASLRDTYIASATVGLPVGLNKRQLQEPASKACRSALERLRKRAGGLRRYPRIHVRLSGLTGDIDDIDRAQYPLLSFAITTGGKNIRGISSRVARRILDSLAVRGWVEPSQGANVTKAQDHAWWWAMTVLDRLSITEIARREQESDPDIDEDAIHVALYRMGIRRGLRSKTVEMGPW